VGMYSTSSSSSSFLLAAAISSPSVRILPTYSVTVWFPYCAIASGGRVFPALARFCNEYIASIVVQRPAAMVWAAT
jgi:hypothetical protein